ncbi:MAG: dynamin family protein, partial [Longimonas sp.]|uniref:dynamin family protein n=1 Tax=Longimonas sp. TaxID=2039626 RepID=UPI003975BC57
MSSPDTSELQADAPSSRIDVDELVNYLETAPIRLAVFGEFSAGKTTMLNALIGEEILSVAVEPTTAVPTRVRYGREFNIFVHRTDGVSLPLFEDDPPFWTRFVGRRDMLSTLRRERASLQDFLRTWTKEGEQADQVERVEIQLPLDWLKDGLELVDTPGANNEFTRHHSFTEQEARTADIALLLMDARQGGGKRTEFEFMNNVQRQVPRCIVAPNKMDLVDAGEREEFIEYIREEALPQHWDGAVTPPVAGISALAALHPDQHDEPDLVAAFDDLKTKLETIATEQRGQLLLARRDNPVKQLFAEAKALEGEEKYDRAHRIYFDVLDILDAAGMDPTPAHEGIQRCETHLSTQVETLDRLNERYNEIAEEYEGDPDKRLEALKALKADKTKLAIDDEKLNAEIQTLQNRI